MKRYLLVLVLSALLLAACGSSEPDPPEPVSFTIEMTEYAFSPSEINVSVGQEVTFTLVNLGQLEHEIMIGRDMVTEDGHANGYAVDMFEHAGVEPVVHGGMLMIDGEMIMEDTHDDDHDDDMEHSDDEMAMSDDDMEHADDEEMQMEDDEHEDSEEMHMDDDHHGHDGLMVMLPVGDETATMTFTVTEEMIGTWEIGCFELEGVHYDAGMKGTFTVSDS